MSSQLESLDDFLGEPVTQVLPGSFLSRPSISFKEGEGSTSRSFPGWRSGMAFQFAAMSWRLRPSKQQRLEEACRVKLRQSVELESLRAPLQIGAEMFQVEPKGQQGDNASSGDETAPSDPSGAQCMCFDLTDSDDETDNCTPSTRAHCKLARHSIEAAFDDRRFLAP